MILVKAWSFITPTLLTRRLHVFASALSGATRNCFVICQPVNRPWRLSTTSAREIPLIFCVSCHLSLHLHWVTHLAASNDTIDYLSGFVLIEIVNSMLSNQRFEIKRMDTLL